MKLEDLLKGSVEPTKIEQSIVQEEPPKVEIPDYLLNDPQVVGYPDLEMQEQIYRMVAGTIYNSEDDTKSRTELLSVKDFGAGRGDIIGWLDGFNYAGYETNRLLVEAGKVKYDGINLVEKDFFQSNLKTDFTICVGTLNSMPTNDKWKLFREVMQKALETTTDKIIFVLANRFDVEGYNDYPLLELVQHLPTNPFELNYTFLEDIYMLVVHVDEFNQ